MNSYIKSFLGRGLVFGGFGPIVVGIVFFVLSSTVEGLLFSGGQVLLAVASSYLLAFLHAGASVFLQVEHWTPLKSLFFHFLTLYSAYSVCYLINSWIPFELFAFLIFTVIFLAVYFVIFTVVFLTVRFTQKRLNQRLGQK